MPEYDLGTAHGRIKIDVDDRGAKQADRSLTDLEKSMRELDARSAKVQASLGKVEKELSKLHYEMKRANDEAQKFDTTVDALNDDFGHAAQRTRDWTRELRTLTDWLHRAVNAAERFGPSFGMISRFVRDFRNNSSFTGFLGALGRSGAAAAGMRMLSRQLFGVNAAMKNASGWQRNLLMFGSSLQRIGAIAGVVSWITKGRVSFLNFGRAIDFSTRSVSKFANKLLGLQILPQTTVRIDRASRALNTFYHSGNNASNGMRRVFSGLLNVAVGTTIMKNSINSAIQAYKKLGWTGKIVVASISAIGVFGAASLELLSKGLVKASNLMLGLADAVKQVGGGINVLPGLFALVFTSVTSLMAIFKGLGTAFADVVSGTEDAETAIMALPPHLQSLGRALADTVGKFKIFRVELQSNFLAKADKQLKILTDQLLPKVGMGMIRVSNAFRNAKDRMFEFALEAQTGRDINRIYAITAQTINSLSAAIKPAARGMRDMAMVGAQFISEMSAGLPGLAEKFAQWAAVNRQNGNLMKWMQESWRGIKDLTKGTVDLIKATGTLLTLFADRSGENALARFAAAMKKFNDTVTKSAASGTLKEIGDAVRGMGSESLEKFKKVFSDVFKTLQAGWPIVKKMVDVIGDVMTFALNKVLKSLRLFFSFFNKQADFGIFDSLQEVLGGLGKAISGATSGIRNFFKSVNQFLRSGSELVQVIASLVTGLIGIEAVIQNLNPVFKFLFDLFQEMMSLTVPFAAAVLGVVLAFGLMHKILGPIKGVIKFFAGTITTMRGLAQSVAGATMALGMFGGAGKKAATALTFLGRALLGVGTAVLIAAAAWMVYRQGQEQISNANKAIGDSADNAKKYVVDLKRAFIADGGIAGDNVFTAIRNSAQQMLDDLENISENSVGSLGQITDFVTAGNGITVAEKFGSPEGLGKWLQAIPIIGSFLNQNTGSSAQVNRLQEIASAAKAAKTEFDSLGWGAEQLQSIISGSNANFEKHKDILLADGEAGQHAATQIQGLRDAYIQTEAAAKELGPTGATLVQGLEELAGSAGNADKKLSGLKKVLEGLGLIKVDSLQAAFDWTEGLNDLAGSMQAIVESGGNLGSIIDKVTGSFNTANPAAKQLFDILAPLGDQFRSAITQPDANPLAVYEDFAGRFKTLVDQVNAASQAAGQGVAITEQQMKNLSNAVGIFKPEELLGQLDKAITGDKELILQFGLDEQSLAKARENLEAILNPQKPLNVPEDNKKEPLLGGGGYFDIDQDAFVEEVTDAMGAAKDAADEEAKKAESSGALFGESFAAGILSAEQAVDSAARAIIDAALDNYHRSPPKKGPLAERGDAILNAGKMFGKQYAKGIDATSGQVSGSASRMAGGAIGATSSGQPGDMPGTGAGKFFGQLLELTSFFSNINNIFSKVSDTVFKALKYMADPMGKGTFFGRSMGFKKTVSDTELAKRAADSRQQAYTSAYDSARRPSDPRDPYGMPMIQGPGALSRDASQSDIQSAIVAEGQRRGLSAAQITSALAIAGQESDYGQQIFGAGEGAFLPGGGKGDAYGVFQQTPEGGWGNVEQLTDPNYAINKFFDAYTEKLKSVQDPTNAAILTQNPQLAGGVEGSEYKKATMAQMEEAKKALESILKSGSILPTESGLAMPGVAALGSLARPSILTDTGSVASSRASETAAAYVAQNFPEVQNIGGSRDNNTAQNTHEVGLAIDIGIPMLKDGVTRDMALGDRINAALKQNADLLNIRYTIWRDVLQNIKDGSTKTVTGHQDHIDVQFNDGSTGNIGPNGTSLRVPYGTQGLLPDNMFGPPLEPGSTLAPPGETVVMNADGTVTRVHGDQAGNAPGQGLNRATGKPWTEEEAQAYFDMNKKRMDLGELTLEQFQQMYTDNNFAQGSTEDQLNRLLQNPDLSNVQDMITNPKNYSEEQINNTLLSLEQYSKDQREKDTAGSRQIAGVADSLQSSLMDSTGFTKNANPIDTVAGLIADASGVASDIIGTIVTGIEAVGAADTIAKVGVRGIANTDDVDTVIDSAQKFIELGAKISGSVASVASLIGSVTGAAGGADPSGGAGAAATAISSVATIASLVQAGFETANAVIDLTQEAFKIAGSYFGDFLGYLVGAGGGQLMGDVRFLLDENTNQLLSYSLNNPLDKRALDMPFTANDTSSRNQLVGNINMYGGPGTDPRDMTRQMMFQVNTAQYAGALAQ